MLKFNICLWFLLLIIMFKSCFCCFVPVTDWPPHQLLLGHAGRVNCLLYPHHLHQRYEKSHLVSGGVDFAVCLWDLYSGTLLHRFCVHAGEITQLLVPPNSCSVSILLQAHDDNKQEWYVYQTVLKKWLNLICLPSVQIHYGLPLLLKSGPFWSPFVGSCYKE